MSKYLDGKVAQIRASEEAKMTSSEVLIQLNKFMQHRMKVNLIKYGDTLNQEYNHKAMEDAYILECLNKLKEGKYNEEGNIDSQGISNAVSEP